MGAAWYRLFEEDEPGYGFVDAQTPELTIAIVPSRRGKGSASELLSKLLEHAKADGYRARSASASSPTTRRSACTSSTASRRSASAAARGSCARQLAVAPADERWHRPLSRVPMRRWTARRAGPPTKPAGSSAGSAERSSLRRAQPAGRRTPRTNSAASAGRRSARRRRPAPRQRPAAERRLVSVLFADLVGFTTLSESRDAEDDARAAHPLLRDRRAADRALRGHGREVHRRRGDGGLGHAGRARGRRRASGSGGARARRRGRGARRRGGLAAARAPAC